MVYRLPGERVGLDLDGPSVTVEPIRSWAIFRLAARRYIAYGEAASPDAELVALNDLYGSFVAEAQPVWDVVDHRGPIPLTAGGMLRLPLPMALRMVELWLDTLEEASDAPATAVDAVIEPGPFRDELNRQLKAKRKAA